MFILSAVFALIAGIALVVYARWTEPIAEAAAAIQGQDPERAVGAYAVSARRFNDIAVSQRVMPGELSLVAHNKLALLYRLGRYDELIEAAAAAPPTAAPHFWSGCAMFRKAEREKKPEAQIEWVGRAADEFKLALTAAPDDWDTKYNFELTSRLSAELRKQPNTPPKQLMLLLRPPTPGSKPARRIG
jgi:hypothetical protein